MLRSLAGCAFVLVAMSLNGCALGYDVSSDATMSSLFVVPESLSTLNQEHFLDQPWPSDLRLENGSPRLEGYYNPNNLKLISEYIDAMKGQLDGFSTAASGFVRFEGSIDTKTLPGNPKEGLDPSASVQLIDIDDTSPDHGKRMLISLEWRETEGVYWNAHTLAYMPTFGFPLRPHTRYAFVVTSKVNAEGGGPIVPSDDLKQVLGLAPASGPAIAAKETFAPALSEVARAGIANTDIVQFAVFTTADPVKEEFEIADALPSVVAAPTADPTKWAVMSSSGTWVEYVGWYGPSPNFQHGKIPFAEYGDGGNFEFKGSTPIVANTFDLRFSLMVPDGTACPMPASGYPIVLYSHGTGGDYESYVEDGTGNALALQCVATMGIDQIFHGARPGAPNMDQTPDQIESQEEVLFFNFLNIVAARTNTRQGGIDDMQRARIFTESHLTVPTSISTTHKPISFDASKLMFFGHSQGGLTGPLYLASDPSSLGGVLSGSSAVISITLLEKTSPPPSVAGLVKSIFLGLNAETASEVDAFHPAISLAQSIVDVVDPINYARYTIQEPRPGFRSKSIYQTEGINPDGTGDTYAPPHGIEAHSIALGLPVELPEQHAILETQWGGPQAVTVPPGGLSGNIGGGTASGVLGQWPVPPGDDGHFVVFDVPSAQIQAVVSIKNLAANPRGNVPAPYAP